MAEGKEKRATRDGRAACGGCAPAVRSPGPVDRSWCDGVVPTESGDVPRARTDWSLRDRLSALRVRLGFRRMDYRVAPGLYAAGRPGAESPVAVSANYKLSFDHLRGALAGHDAWILVLDTKGINVWCAAGKGTFGTDEIVRRVTGSGLERIVAHRTLVVPQLGAPGVAAHEVRRLTGFRVVYGPVRARDLPAFLDAGGKATPEMRRVRFGLRDRAVLVPVEVAVGGRYPLLAAAVLALLAGFGPGGYSPVRVVSVGLPSAAVVLGSFAGAAILGPLLLPWLPGRPFSVKGAALGLLFALLLAAASRGASAGPSEPGLFLAAWALIAVTIASFTVMNFTGAATFTSLSGVLREMRFAVPAQIAGGVAGLGLWVAGLFLGGGR